MAESHRMLVEAYGDSALSESACQKWFQWFKAGNFNLTDKVLENRPRQVEDQELQDLLDVHDSQSQKMLGQELGVTQQAISKRLRAMGKISEGRELNNRQLERRRKTSEILLAGAEFFRRGIRKLPERWEICVASDGAYFE